MFAIALWTFIAALLGRALLPGGPKPSVLWATACAAAGFAVCFALARVALGQHELQLFSPECLVPAAGVTTILLWVVRWLSRRQRPTVFY